VLIRLNATNVSEVRARHRKPPGRAGLRQPWTTTFLYYTLFKDGG
jgi:hypothetical protein